MLFIQSLGRTKCVLFFLLFFFTLSIAQAQVPSYIPTNGLVGYWPFNGNANDVSGNGNHGSLGNVLSAADRFGNPNGAYYMNDSKITFGSNFQVASNQSYTFSAWVKIDLAEETHLFSQRSSTGYNGLEILIEANEIWPYYGSTQADHQWHQTTNGIAYGSFNLVSVVYNTTTDSVITYVNGYRTGGFGISGVGAIESSELAFIGAKTPLPGVAKFTIDDFGIHNRSLSNQEILSMYNGGAPEQAACPVLSSSLQNGLIGYWPFCGNANDESGNGNHGTVNGATLTTDRNGNASSAYSFDGVNDLISLGNIAPNLGAPNMSSSISVWFKTDVGYMASSNNSEGTLITDYKRDGICCETQYLAGLVVLNQPSKILWRSEYPGNVNEFSFETQIANSNQWVNLIVTRDGIGTQKMYINGQLSSESSYNASINFTLQNIPFEPDWNIGAQRWNNGSFASDYVHHFKGEIDDLSMWNRELTPEEITTLYTGQLPTACLPDYVPTNGLVGYWPFCGNADDESGNGNNGTVNGATLTTDRNGNANSAYSFSASEQDFIVAPQSGMNSTTGTFSAWVDFSGPIGGGDPNEALNWYTIIEPLLLNADLNDGRYQKLIVNYNNQPISTSNLTFNAWHLVTVTIESSGQTTFYIDGLESGSQVISGAFNLLSAANLFFFGKSSNNAWYWNGKIDDIAIYNRALTPSEIQQLYTGVECITPTAEITAGGPTSFCAGGNVVLNATNDPSFTYQWSLNGNPISGATSASYSANASGNYAVTVTSGPACSTISSATAVTVNALPTATITPASSTTFCAGSSVVLNANSGNGLTYQWRLNGNNISGATNGSYTANAAGSYSVVVTNASGCSATSAARTVTVTSLPNATITPGSSTTFCSGSSVVLNENSGNGLTYQWRLNGNIINGATNGSYTANAAGSYSVVVTNLSGCSATSAATTVTVNALPNATITPASSTTFCQGGSVVLNANTAAGLTYQWRLNSNNITGATNGSYTANATGSYTVLVTNASGCSATSAARTVTVTSLPNATITPASSTTFCSGSSVVLNANSGNGLTYQWRLNGNTINGATNGSYTANAAGSYTVVVTNASSCANTSSGVVLNMLALPAPVVTPVVNDANIGQNASFSVSNPNGPATYTWQTNPENTGWINVPSNATYSGGASSNLLVSNIQLGNHQQPFRVIAVNGICSTTSALAYLNVLDTCVSSETVIVYDTLTAYNQVDVYDTIPVYNNIDVYDTLTTYTSVYDTLITYNTVQVYDTLITNNYIDVYDTLTTYNTINVFDTLLTYNTINVFDTLVTYNTVEVYDTLFTNNYIDVYDTLTTYNTVNVYDTLTTFNYIDVYDTLTTYTSVNVYDTLYTYNTIDVYDTLTTYNVVELYDTLTVFEYETHYDTLITYETLEVYDTLTTYNVVELYDTLTVFEYETLYDTLITYETVEVYDTLTTYNVVELYDTIYTTVTDTLYIDVPTGINPPNEFNLLRVYPNPASDQITIDYGDYGLLNGYSLKITNSIAQTVFITNINTPQSIIDISNWASGLYALQVFGAGGEEVSRKTIVVAE